MSRALVILSLWLPLSQLHREFLGGKLSTVVYLGNLECMLSQLHELRDSLVILMIMDVQISYCKLMHRE